MPTNTNNLQEMYSVFQHNSSCKLQKLPTNIAPETFNMNTSSIHDKAEQATEALLRKDQDFFESFLHDSFLYINTQGTPFTKQEYIRSFLHSDNTRFITQHLHLLSGATQYPFTTMDYIVHDHFLWNGKEYRSKSRSKRIYLTNPDNSVQWFLGHTFSHDETAWHIPHLLCNTIELCPLSFDDIDGLLDAADDARLWHWTLQALTTRKEMEEYIRIALRDHALGLAIPFVIKNRKSGEYIGSTRFGCIDRENKNAEIGWTWIKPSYQRSSVNTEMKFAMLAYAFEELLFHRISIITDSRNIRSQKAIERIGAKKEGIIRSHLIAQDNGIRDSVSYSIIREEWEQNKNHFFQKLLRTE